MRHVPDPRGKGRASGTGRLGSGSCPLMPEAPLPRPTPASTGSLPKRRPVLVALLLSLLLALAACGGSPSTAGEDSGSTGASDTGWPVTVTGDNGELTIDAQPEAIVVDVGHRDRDAVRDRRRPAGRGRRQHVQLPGGRPGHRPVRVHPERRGDRRLRPRPGRAQRRHERDRRRARAPWRFRFSSWLRPRRWTTATSSSRPSAPRPGTPTTPPRSSPTCRTGSTPRWSPSGTSGAGLRVYHELDPTFYSAASSTFIGGVYELFGLENIADGAEDASGGYPQLSAEYVVGAGAGPRRAGRHRVLRADARRPSPSGRRSTRCRPCRRAGCSPPTTTSPPAGARGWPTSPSRSPRRWPADESGR